jgi:hypothetical protein
VVVAGAKALLAQAPGTDVARLHRAARSQFARAGWRQEGDAAPAALEAHTVVTVAELAGPGVIRHLHVSRHQPVETMARGIVLQIYFDDALQPAVSCPVADFFADGGGRAGNFSACFVECKPGAYNSYFPMPFRDRAKIVLRNDTDQAAADASYVQWEALPAWNTDLGYFHATYRREAFQLTRKSRQTVFEVQAGGHLVGRHYMIGTDERLFREFRLITAGNHEVDVDGAPRTLDYPNMEGSFTFGEGGLRRRSVGLRAGVPLVAKGRLHEISLYRFHDVAPIHFRNSLKWSITWEHEKAPTEEQEWTKAIEAGGCWVDLATVHYWYQADPGAYQHQILPPVDERIKPLLRSSVALPEPKPEGEGVGPER